MDEADLEPIAERLEAVSDELAELAMSAIRTAIEDGRSTRPPIEKRITRARRAVDKAAALLRDRPASTAP
jgi:hypothetical protein